MPEMMEDCHHLQLPNLLQPKHYLLGEVIIPKKDISGRQTKSMTTMMKISYMTENCFQSLQSL